MKSLSDLANGHEDCSGGPVKAIFTLSLSDLVNGREDCSGEPMKAISNPVTEFIFTSTQNKPMIDFMTQKRGKWIELPSLWHELPVVTELQPPGNHQETTSSHCEGWWLSGCRSSVAEHWLHKPGVLDLILATASLFTSSNFASKQLNSLYALQCMAKVANYHRASYLQCVALAGMFHERESVNWTRVSGKSCQCSDHLATTTRKLPVLAILYI